MTKKSIIAERLIRNFKKNRIYKYVTWISKNVYNHKLDDIVNQYDNTYHSKIKMKPADVKSNTYIDSSKNINDKSPEFAVGDIVKISKCQSTFAKIYTSNWSEEIFVIKKRWK